MQPILRPAGDRFALLVRELAGLEVCFLAGTLGQGGAERQLFYILAALKNAGANPRVLCLTNGEHWQRRIESLGVEITWVGQNRFRSSRLLKIIAELRHRRPALVQSQHFYTNLYVSAATRLLGLPEIGAIRNDAIEEITANPGYLGRQSLMIPKAIAANSRAGIENAIALGVSPNKLFFLPNVVDTSLFTTRSRVSENHVRLLTIGRLVAAKRIDRFIRLVAELTRLTDRPVNAMIAGDGILRTALERQAIELGLDDTIIRFLGQVHDPSRLYHESDIMVLTSDREGTPNVVLEAMASGLPVVATKVGGLADIVRDGETGYLVEPGNQEALTNAVLDLVTDRARRMQFGANARSFVEKHHSLSFLAGNLLRLYEAVLA